MKTALITLLRSVLSHQSQFVSKFFHERDDDDDDTFIKVSEL